MVISTSAWWCAREPSTTINIIIIISRPDHRHLWTGEVAADLLLIIAAAPFPRWLLAV